MTSAEALTSETFLASILPLAQSGQWDSVHTECLEHIRNAGEDAAVLYVLGLAAYERNDIAGAASAANRALAAGFQFFEGADLIAIAHGLAGDINTALYFAKLAITLPDRPDLQAFQSADYPTFAAVLGSVEEGRLINRAKVAIGMGHLNVADSLLRQHLSFFPEDEDAMVLVALCLSLQGNHFDAADWLRGTIHRRPTSGTLISALANELDQIGDVSDARALHERAATLAPDDLVIHIRQIVDIAYDPAASPEEVSQLAQQWGKRFASTAEAEDAPLPAEAPAILNVGVILADLPGTAPGRFFADVLSRANPAEFRLIGYGFGTLTDVDNAAFQSAISEWYDLSDLDADTVGDMLRAESLDVIIDTAGFVSPLTLAALGSRCAPRQLLWRNAPCDFGLSTIDGQLSDVTLDAATKGPAPHHRLIPLRHGSVLAQLPPADTDMIAPAARSGTGIVFGADVALRQLTAETVAWWAELLLALPESMLVLRDKALSKPKAVERLTAVFGNFGVAHRIDLIDAKDNADFWAQADIALMPTRMAGTQNAIETLWAGIPVLAPELPERSNRELASVLRHAGLDELVAGSIPEFVHMGVEWAKDSGRRESFRESIRGRLSNSPAFDPEARAQDLWQACRQLYS